MCIHQGGVVDVLINGLTAELDGRIDLASAGLIIAQAGWKNSAAVGQAEQRSDRLCFIVF